MAKPKPIGFDNWKTFSFVSNDGSGVAFFRKASFSLVAGSDHALFVGPSIASTSVAADCGLTTAEPHGFIVGQSVTLHNIPGTAGTALNGPQIVTAVPSTTTFRVGVDTSALVATAGMGVAGVDLEAVIPVANFAVIPGDFCRLDHPEAWEMPLVG